MRKLCVGDWVEVRSKNEILATLDQDGRLDGLPFMPQMFQFCGLRFQVLARAHKTCDVVAGTGRWLPDGIHLNLRCDGMAYGGCEAACLLFWKDAWLKHLSSSQHPALKPEESPRSRPERPVKSCTEADVWRATSSPDPLDGTQLYFCQATRVPFFTKQMAWWDIRQYVEDFTSGNVSFARLLRGILYQTYHHVTQAWRPRIGRPARLLYDAFQCVIDGIPFPRKQGMIEAGQRSPTSELRLQPGELVRVKSHAEILTTITKGGLNRGLLFDKEMVPYCGRTFRVQARVSRFVSERTGRLTTLRTPAVILEDVWCRSRYSNKKMFCPRSIYSWWREIWLERVPTEQVPSDELCPLRRARTAANETRQA